MKHLRYVTLGISFTLILIGSAAALEAEDKCGVKKTKASGKLFQCLVKAHTKIFKENLDAGRADRLKEKCVEKHIRRYATAEARAARREADAACVARDELRTRQAIEASAQSLIDGDSSPAACATIDIDEDNAKVTCQLTKPAKSTTVNSVDLNDIITQLGSLGVTADTVVWFQIWGAHAGKGSGKPGGTGGEGGYAQMITTVNEFKNPPGGAARGSVIYFYLGQQGTHNTNSGGQGGASTFMSGKTAIHL